MNQVYGAKFYESQVDGAKQSAREIVPLVLRTTGASSVVDVGCGLGAWLSAYADCGVERYVGLDGPWVDAERLLIPAERFRSLDLTNPLPLEERFDLAQSLEVAEHLEERHAAKLVNFLTSLADVVVFSAASPFQGGTNHVNERWPEYWRELFEACEFDMYDVFRPHLWNRHGVEWWYAQNMFLYVRQGTNRDLTERLARYRGWVYPERAVHPYRIDPSRLPPPSIKGLAQALSNAIAGRLQGLVRFS